MSIWHKHAQFSVFKGAFETNGTVQNVTPDKVGNCVKSMAPKILQLIVEKIIELAFLVKLINAFVMPL